MKILATTPIPTQDLFALRNELTMLSEHVEKLLRYSFVEEPKPEASPSSNVEPKKENSFEDGVLQGLTAKDHAVKPVVLVNK